jgi:hypothetical protein
MPGAMRFSIDTHWAQSSVPLLVLYKLLYSTSVLEHHLEWGFKAYWQTEALEDAGKQASLLFSWEEGTTQ